MPEIEEQIIGGIVLDGSAVHGRCQRKPQQETDSLGHLAICQVRRNSEASIAHHGHLPRGLPQEWDGQSHDSIYREMDERQ
jgi:hypothetical protein